MAHALLCAGGTGMTAPVVTIPNWTPSNQSNWGCRFKIRTGSNVTADITYLGYETSPVANGGFKVATTGGNLVVLYSQYWNTNDWLSYPVTINTDYDFLYKVTATAFELWNNTTNTLLVSKTLTNRAPSGRVMATTVVGRNIPGNTGTNQSPAGARYYNVDLIDYTTPSNSRYYDANLSGGTGPSFPTTTGTDNGTQSGTWPANDEEWIFYNSVLYTGIPSNTLGAALNQPCTINLNNYFIGATSYSVLSGSLPTGLSIVGNQIVGTPTTEQSTQFVIRASNSVDMLDSATITFNTGLWYCNFSGTNQRRIAIPFFDMTVGTSVELRINKDPLSSGKQLLGIGTNDTYTDYFELTTGGVLGFNLRAGNVTTTGALAPSLVNGENVIVLHRFSTSVYKLTVNGVAQADISNAGQMRIGAIGATNQLYVGAFSFYSAKFYNSSGVLVRHYDPSANGGVGNLLIDTISYVNGTQAGTWPADNAEWVSYAPVGGTDGIVSLVKSTITTLAKSISIATGSEVTLIKSYSTVSSKSVQSQADATVNLVKSQPVVIGKLVIGQTDASVSASVNLLKSTETVASKLLNATADCFASVIKSQQSVLAKTFSVSAGANVNLSKSTLTVVGKLVIGATDSSIDAFVTISKGAVTIRPIVQNVVADANSSILISNAVVREYDIQTTTDAIVNLNKSTLLVRGRLLQVGREPTPIGIERIFAIEVDEKIFSVINEQIIFTLEK